MSIDFALLHILSKSVTPSSVDTIQSFYRNIGGALCIPKEITTNNQIFWDESCCSSETNKVGASFFLLSFVCFLCSF